MSADPSRPPNVNAEGPAPPAPPAAPPAAALSSAQHEPHLFDRISVLYKYRWASIAVFIAVVGWVMVDSYTKIPVYQASARVLIEDPGADLATPTEIQRSVTSTDPEIYMQTQLRIMRGRDLAERVAQKLNLSTVPEFNGQGAKPTPLAQTISLVKYYAAWPYRLVTTATAPPVSPPSSDGDATGYGAALLGRLSVDPVRGSQLVDVTVSSSDPEFAARAANTYADEYVAENLQLKIQSLEKSAEWLTGEVARQAKLVEQSELALAQYREKQGAQALGTGQNTVVQTLTAFNETLTKARTDRITKENVWKQVQAAGKNADTLSAILSNQQVQLLRNAFNDARAENERVSEKYGEKHPDRQRAANALAAAERNLSAEIDKAIQNAKNEYEAALTQERVLVGQ